MTCRQQNQDKTQLQQHLEIEARAAGVAVISQGRLEELAAAEAGCPPTFFTRVELPERLRALTDPFLT